jgi:hypothetical protein
VNNSYFEESEEPNQKKDEESPKRIEITQQEKVPLILNLALFSGPHC